MGPFFFLELGSTIVMDMQMFANTILYSVIMYVLLFIGQFLSAAGAAKYVPGGFDWPDSIMIGFGMIGRAELFFVVLELCTNQYSIMDGEQMFAFAMTAMFMNVSVPVSITLYKPYYCKWTGYDCSAEKDGMKKTPSGGHGAPDRSSVTQGKETHGLPLHDAGPTSHHHGETSAAEGHGHGGHDLEANKAHEHKDVNMSTIGKPLDSGDIEIDVGAPDGSTTDTDAGSGQEDDEPQHTKTKAKGKKTLNNMICGACFGSGDAVAAAVRDTHGDRHGRGRLNR